MKKTYFTPKERYEMLLAMHIKDEQAKEQIREAVSEMIYDATKNARIETFHSEAGINALGH